MKNIHTQHIISITDLKKNPIQVANQVTCVVAHSKPVFYCVPIEEYERLIKLGVDDES